MLCAFDCRAVNGHTFVLHIGCVVDKQGLLNAAGLSGRNDIAVFVGRQPWPLPHNIRIDLADGDLLAFIPESGTRDPVHDISHILRGPEASPDHIDFPRTLVEAAWVLHAGEGFHFEVPPDRRSSVRRDLADTVQVLVHQLVIRPAKPAIVDHAVRGAPSRNVLATCRCQGSHYNEPRDTVVILDVRPILLTFTWWSCSQGTLALSEVQSRFGDRCPQGFCIGLLTVDGFFVDADARIAVQDGEHVTVVFTEAEGDTADETNDPDDGELRRAGTAQGADDTAQAPGPSTGAGQHHGSTGGTNGWPSGSSPNQGSALGDPTSNISRRDRSVRTISSPPDRRSCAAPPCRTLAAVVALQSITIGVATRDVVISSKARSCALADGSRASAQRPIATPCRGRGMPPSGATNVPPTVPPFEARSETIASLHPAQRASISTWPNKFRWSRPDSNAAVVLGPDIDSELAFGDLKLGFSPRDLHDLFHPGTGHDLPEGPVCYTDGSFIPASDPALHRSGWACIFVDKQSQCCDVIAGKIPQPFLEGTCQSAFKAECCALIVAFWVGVSALKGRGFQILSDCQAAISIANGTAAVHTTGIARLLAHVADACRSAATLSPGLTYIPGHSDVLGNEIADVTAKSAAAGLPLGSIHWGLEDQARWWADQGTLWAWAGVVCRWAKGDDALPSPLGQAIGEGRHHGGASSADLVAPFIPKECAAPANGGGRLRLCAVSYNALTLATERTGPVMEGLAFRPGRPAMLAQQLSQAGVSFAAIQEARTEEGFVFTEPFLRYCSGAVKGHFGVEVWFRQGHKISLLADERGGAQFEKSAFIVLHKDPRRIVTLFKCGSLQIIFASLHAPHRGNSPAEITQWWTETEDLLFRASRGRSAVVGMDANASLGSVTSRCVSHVGEETQDHPGDCLHQLMHKCGLWAPATFEGVQQGPTWTFMQRRNGATTRPDYVIIPQEWRQGQLSNWTDASIVAANSVIDHIATVARISVQLRGAAGRSKGRAEGKGCRIDARALVDPSNQARLSEVLQGAPRPNWEVTAHAHVANVTSYLQDALTREFPAAQRKPMHPYLSAEAWALQQQVAWLGRKCANVRNFIRQQTLLACFLTWQSEAPKQGGAPRPNPAPEGSRWLREAQVAEALYGFRLGAFARALRARCKTDRAGYVANLADDVQAGRPEAHRAVNKLLGRKRGKPFTPAVLPGIEDAQGNLCVTPEDTVARWREYFSALEDGIALSRPELSTLANPESHSLWPSPGCINSLPSPLDLRNAILVTKRGKASGPDALPGELGLGCAEGLQQLLFPICLKLGLLGEEALGHKSGGLTWLYKGKGPQTQCTSYRGILLLSNLCKAIHRAYRPCIQRHFETVAHPLQLGGRRGGSVLFGSFAMRTFMRWRAAQGLSSAVIFADVSSAYYCTARELAARLPAEEPKVQEGNDRDRMPSEPDDLSVDKQTAQPSAMMQTGAEPWLRAVTATINSNTWMVLQGDSVPIATRRGTRPGSAWADLTFELLLVESLSCGTPVGPHLSPKFVARRCHGTTTVTGGH